VVVFICVILSITSEVAQISGLFPQVGTLVIVVIVLVTLESALRARPLKWVVDGAISSGEPVDEIADLSRQS
jgi:hypothetical protein